MGYDITRFVGEVDEEFHCSICSMVFVNPVQTPCEHVFCKECIAPWLLANATCPIDRIPLSYNDLKTPGRPFSNLLAKLKLNCNFEREGCEMVVELGNIQQHIENCKFSPKSEITCEKGCNGKIRRHELQTHNCLFYLSTFIGELKNENIKIQLKVIRQEEEITKLKTLVEEHNTELNEEIRRLKEQITKPNEVLKLSPIWKVRNNVRFLEESNILECESDQGYAQSNCPLTPDSSSFLLEVLKIPSGGVIAIGLASEGNGYEGELSNFIEYYQHTYLGKVIYGVGDFIECGIKYPQNFNANQSTKVVLYFSINRNTVYKKDVMLPSGLFPTIEIFAPGIKLKISYNAST